MTEPGKDRNTDLAEYFAAAQRDSADLPAGLMDRMLNDAAQTQRTFSNAAQVRPALPGWFVQMRQTLGGWPGLGGLVAACATGIWLGFAPPSILPDPFDLVGVMQSDVNIFDVDDLAAAWIEEG